MVFLQEWIIRYRISCPKGVSAKPASLKCCIPKGMPIMVIQKSTPKIAWVRKIHTPPIKNQIMFIKLERQPCADSLFVISAPNGHKASMPSLIDCKPKGIPIIVINKKTLAIKYSRAIKIPPKTNQIIFPIIFM